MGVKEKGSLTRYKKAFILCRFNSIEPKLADNKFAIVGELPAKYISYITGEDTAKLRVFKHPIINPDMKFQH